MRSVAVCEWLEHSGVISACIKGGAGALFVIRDTPLYHCSCGYRRRPRVRGHQLSSKVTAPCCMGRPSSALRTGVIVRKSSHYQMGSLGFVVDWKRYQRLRVDEHHRTCAKAGSTPRTR